MKVICTRCGGTNIACEAIVNPNTGKIIGNKVIDFEKCEDNYLDVYPLIGAVL